jgi:probable HAF family extracellular repeat protein
MSKSIITICATVLICALSTQIPLTAQDYLVTDLDSNQIALDGTAFRISENGTAVGVAAPLSGYPSQAALWTSEGTTFLPPIAGHDFGLAYDISEQGIVVGESDETEQVGGFVKVYPHAAIWSSGRPIALSSLVTGGASFDLRYAHRINEKGQILGFARDDALSVTRAFLFEGGFVTDLGSLQSMGSSEPFDMNEQGRVVGFATSAPSSFNHAFLWKDGIMTDLHDSLVIRGPISTARAINEFGVIAGSADFLDDGSQNETAALWNNGTITDLGTLGGTTSFARDINDHGTVVGISITSSWEPHAFIYEGDKMVDLNTLIPQGTGWSLAGANSINNSGIIVGEGFYNGIIRPFILFPDCTGGFRIYGNGGGGSDGYVPGLYGQGDPVPGGEISLVVLNGAGGTAGWLLTGSGYGTMQVGIGSYLQILPLNPLRIPLLLAGTGAGAGCLQITASIPTGMPPTMFALQAILDDPGVTVGYPVSNPLEMNIR